MRYFSSAPDWQKLGGPLAGSESTLRFCLAALVRRWRFFLCECMCYVYCIYKCLICMILPLSSSPRRNAVPCPSRFLPMRERQGDSCGGLLNDEPTPCSALFLPNFLQHNPPSRHRHVLCPRASRSDVSMIRTSHPRVRFIFWQGIYEMVLKRKALQHDCQKMNRTPIQYLY